MTPLHEMLAAYRKFVVKDGVLLNPDTARERLLLGAAGLGGEAGEVIDLIKKQVFHGRTIDRNEFVLEIGDVLWYLTLIMDTLDITIDEVLTANMVKLANRYPEKHPDLRHLITNA